MYLGDYAADSTVEFKWNTRGADGASITRATDGSLRIYKDDSTTERSSSAGITDSEDFDSLTGVHHLTIDLSDNTDAGFYAAGHEYSVVLQGAVIDTKTVNAVIAHFSIERSGGILATLKSVISSGRVLVSTGIRKNTALANFEFQMVDSTDHFSPKTGLTVTAERSIDGAAYGACANSPSEVSDGTYVIDLDASDLNGDLITFKFTATGADPTYIEIRTTP